MLDDLLDLLVSEARVKPESVDHLADLSSTQTAISVSIPVEERDAQTAFAFVAVAQ